MNYKITITGDDETIYTHEWENESDNILFGNTPKLAELTGDEFLILGTVLKVVGTTIADFRYYNAEDIPTEPTTDAGDVPDYVEEKMMQEILSQIFASIESDVMFAGVEASA